MKERGERQKPGDNPRGINGRESRPLTETQPVIVAPNAAPKALRSRYHPRPILEVATTRQRRIRAGRGLGLSTESVDNVSAALAFVLSNKLLDKA